MDLDRQHLPRVERTLEAGHEADDLLRAALTGGRPRSWVHWLLGVIGLSSYLDGDRPSSTAELIRRAANTLDVFAADLRSTAAALADDQLTEEAARLDRLGQALWTEEISPAEAHHQLAPALGMLLQRRTWLTLGRMAGFDETG